MKSIIKHLLKVTCVAAFCAMPIYASEPEPFPSPSASPSATPDTEPSPSPSPDGTPHGDPSPSPSATPIEQEHHGELSLRGFYQGVTPTGAVAVFYIEANTHVQIHLLDEANQTISFAEGVLTNGAFSLTLTNGQLIAGSANEDGIAVTLGTVAFQASRVSTFGGDSSIGGRYFGVAHGANGESRVMFIIDANHHILMIQRTGTVLTGGYGTINAPVAPSTSFTFTLEHTIGSTSAITGSFRITDGVFDGTFTTSAGTFTVFSSNSSTVNHLANISTRGLVGTGQGQLIGGFIITGGPKLVLIRAKGPSLAAGGVTTPLANPSLQLFSGTTALGANDDWRTNTNAAQIVASTLAPTDDLEAALLVRLEPGAYTTVVSGASDATGIALVEVYEMGFE
jgi:hypothetical protein